MQVSRKRASGLNARVAAAVIAALAVTTTLAMAVIPALMTSSSSTIVQSAWAQEIPEIPDASSLIEQHDVPDAGELVEENRVTIPQNLIAPRPQLGMLPIPVTIP